MLKYFKNNKIFILLTIIYIPLFRYYANLNLNGGHSFMTADWLISYKFGYISRGLFGTFLIPIFNNATVMLNFLSIFLILVYLLIFYFVSEIFKSRQQTIVTYVLILSPATFLFNIYDSQGSFRKEILGILAIFFIAYSISRSNYYIYISSFIYTMGIFSHSVNLFFLTTILLIIYLHLKPKKLTPYFAFLIPTILNFILYFSFSNSEQELTMKKNMMCLDLERFDLENLCGYGSFDFISWDLNAAYLITQNYIINENRQGSFTYILLFLLAIIPLFFDKNIFHNIWYYSIIAISFVPLFLIGLDWGRWIYIMVICFLIIYMLSEKKIVRSNIKYCVLLTPILFRVEHCCSPVLEFNLIENFKYLSSSLVSILF